jgi:hypothetical protein
VVQQAAVVLALQCLCLYVVREALRQLSWQVVKAVAHTHQRHKPRLLLLVLLLRQHLRVLRRRLPWCCCSAGCTPVTAAAAAGGVAFALRLLLLVPRQDSQPGIRSAVLLHQR